MVTALSAGPAFTGRGATSLPQREQAAAADEVLRRILDAVGPTPEPSELVTGQDLGYGLLVEIADGVDLVVVLAAEDDLAGGRDVEVLERA
jgi:hypothetical protein